jgi:hypothetical protein
MSYILKNSYPNCSTQYSKDEYGLGLLEMSHHSSMKSQNESAIPSSTALAWTYHCVRSLFQHFTNMYAWFTTMAHHFHSAGTLCGLLGAQTNGSPKELSEL